MSITQLEPGGFSPDQLRYLDKKPNTVNPTFASFHSYKSNFNKVATGALHSLH